MKIVLGSPTAIGFSWLARVSGKDKYNRDSSEDVDIDMEPNPSKTQAVKNFLTLATHPDLAGLYNHDLECQVNVDQDGGERVEGDYKGKQWHAWTDGIQVWKSFRIPHNANSEPSYDDTTMNFDLAAHVVGIGMTGWDWKSRVSKWVGFDFDAITGHSDRHAGRLLDTQLHEVEQAAQDIPWVTVRRSTSGNGLHLYVFLDNFPTRNHTEHAAVARSILGVMSAITGFDFQAKVDTCGGNMWVWHRKMKGTNGLTLLKQGITFLDVPVNWRDHLKVIAGSRRKNLPQFIADSPIQDADSMFEELTGQRSQIQLDEDHKKLVQFLTESNAVWWWDNDHHMLVTHTIHLKDAHEQLSLKGTFDTLATGTERGADHNCFMFPIRKGAWAIRRYSIGVAEAPTWDQDGAGWTRCYFNREPDLSSASRSAGGNEHPQGGYHFRHASDATKTASAIGVDLGLPTWAAAKKARLKQHKDGRLIAEVEHDPTMDYASDMQGWIAEGKYWKRIFNTNIGSSSEPEIGNYDDMVRHLVTETGDDYGWMLKSGDTLWRNEPLVHVRTALKSTGMPPKDAEMVLGSSIFKCWTMVNRPFQPEYPGDRQWNRGAAQFKFHPSQAEIRNFPHWLKILAHLGQGLDEAIKENGWAKANGILSGSDYLKVWIAALFQNPLQPLPYLFFYSEKQNTGKSIFHEALGMLVTTGRVRADAALTSSGGFNGELENAVLCVVEETDLRRNKQAYARIKDWVNSPEMPIHKKAHTPYSIPNTTHWIQCANDHQACPVFTGDTRITMIQVEPLDKSELIPKPLMMQALQKEAPDFLAEVLSLEIPPSNDRLNVPVIDTEEKRHLEKTNQSYLNMFIAENCYPVTGAMIKFGEFCERFTEWLGAAQAAEWSKIRIGRELPPQFPSGRIPTTGYKHVGNLAWEPYKHGDPILPKLVARDDKLVPAQNVKR